MDDRDGQHVGGCNERCRGDLHYLKPSEPRKKRDLSDLTERLKKLRAELRADD